MNGRLNQLILHDKHTHHRGNYSGGHGNHVGHGYPQSPANHVPAILHNLAGQGGRAMYSSQHHMMVPATRIGGQPTAWKSQGPHARGDSNTQIVYDKGNVRV